MSSISAPHRRALSNIGGTLKSRGDPKLVACFERAWLRARKESADELTHGFHTYPARMHPSLANEILVSLALSEARVLDPFCGSGTTLVEARRQGLRCAGVDLNPLALRVASVKSRTVTSAMRTHVEECAESVSRASEERVRAKAPSRAPLSPHDIKLYAPHVLRELAGLLTEIQSVEDEDTRQFLEIVFSSMAIKFSQQKADTSREQSEKKIGRLVPTRFFLRKTLELCERLGALNDASPTDGPTPSLYVGDARKLPQVLPRGHRYDLVLSSPPYGGTYDYHAHHRLRLAWLQIKGGQFEKHEVGSRRRLSQDPKGAGQWDREMLDVLKAIVARLYTRGAHAPLIVFVMGDGHVGGRRIPADKQLEFLAHEAGLECVAVSSETREDWQGGPARKEHLIALRLATSGA